MTIIIAFLTVLAAIVAWWLSHHRLAAKPWLEEGPIGDGPYGADTARWPAAKVGLCVFLAVVGSLFALLISAYSIRMGSVDWTPLPEVGLLWLNTGVLVISSVALQSAVVAARRRQMDVVGAGLAAGGISALLFLSGQVLVWQRLMAAGYFAESNPASAFFYLLTAVHGLHLAGGILALGRVGAKVWLSDGESDEARLGVELCALYWHFLLVIWVAILALLVFGAWFEWLYAVCFGS